MDPSKRICIKNLPENCTKREIANMIHNRCGVQPHSIDLGLDENGVTRRYAHFSCEGAKNVLDALSGGSTLRGNVIHVLPAKKHYTWSLAQAREKREREEEEEKEKQRVFWENFRQRLEARGNNGEISPHPKKLRSFYYGKQRYGVVASEIAKKFRARHQASYPSQNFHRPSHSYLPPALLSSDSTLASSDAAHFSDPWGASPTSLQNEPSAYAASAKKDSNSVVRQVPRMDGRRLGEKNDAFKKAKDEDKSKTANRQYAGIDVAQNITVAPASVTPEPSKRERKLSRLQGKLAILKQKLER